MHAPTLSLILRALTMLGVIGQVHRRGNDRRGLAFPDLAARLLGAGSIVPALG